MYSPLGLVIFVAVEGTFVCFTKGRMLGVVSHYISFLCYLHAINAYSIKDTACMYKRI